MTPFLPLATPSPLSVRLLSADGRLLDRGSPPIWGAAARWCRDVDERADVVVQLMSTERVSLPLSLRVELAPDLGRRAAIWEATDDLPSALDTLASAILVPSAYPGLIGVDLQDYAHGLQGRRIRIHRVRAPDAGQLAMRFESELPLWIAGVAPAFTAVHLSVPASTAAVALIDRFAHALERRLPDAEVVLALTVHGEHAFDAAVVVADESTGVPEDCA